jgi:ribonuclease-3
MKKLIEFFDLRYNNEDLLNRALTHSSYANENNCQSNERLEFIGDAVLDVMMGDYLYHKHPNKDEGFLTKTRAKYVCESALYLYAMKCHLDQYVLLGKGEEKSGGRQRQALLADAFEALIGSVYMDKGFDECFKIFDKVVKPSVENECEEEFVDYKSRLQELVQSDKRSLQYKIVNESGPSHNKTFSSRVYMDEIVMGEGQGKTKKEAEQHAAKEALDKLAAGQ